ncbi:MAG TPA: hypothetical protein VEL31_02475 [Ktedonobacteraceae bacterium]|nr:hypothetical protein [Ktedonobacteraceae bacterium]
MINTVSNMITWAEKRDEKIFAAAQPGAVYSEPVTAGNYTVITASEIAAGGGFGSVLGFGLSTTPPKQQGETSQPQAQPGNGGGSGIGGGGGSTGRPVAIIIIGPDGVTVKPVFDLTKIALAGITAWTTMLAVLRRARKG